MTDDSTPTAPTTSAKDPDEATYIERLERSVRRKRQALEAIDDIVHAHRANPADLGGPGIQEIHDIVEKELWNG